MPVTQPKDAKRSDGKSVYVTVASPVDKGEFVRKPYNTNSAFYGFAEESAPLGTEDIAICVAQYEFELVLGASVTADKDDILYFLTTTGAIVDVGSAGTPVTLGGNDSVPFMKVTVTKDANNVVWGLLLPQTVTW